MRHRTASGALIYEFFTAGGPLLCASLSRVCGLDSIVPSALTHSTCVRAYYRPSLTLRLIDESMVRQCGSWVVAGTQSAVKRYVVRLRTRLNRNEVGNCQ